MSSTTYYFIKVPLSKFIEVTSLQIDAVFMEEINSSDFSPLGVGYFETDLFGEDIHCIYSDKAVSTVVTCFLKYAHFYMDIDHEEIRATRKRAQLFEANLKGFFPNCEILRVDEIIESAYASYRKDDLWIEKESFSNDFIPWVTSRYTGVEAGMYEIIQSENKAGS